MFVAGNLQLAGIPVIYKISHSEFEVTQVSRRLISSDSVQNMQVSGRYHKNIYKTARSDGIESIPRNIHPHQLQQQVTYNVQIFKGRSRTLGLLLKAYEVASQQYTITVGSILL